MSQPLLQRLCTLAYTTCGQPAETLSQPVAQATSLVVRLRCGDTHVIGKIHRSLLLHEREVRAYREWVPSLGTGAPRLLAVDSGLPGILMSAAPGTPLAELGLDPATEQEAHHAAGILLRRLHQIPVATPASEITRYLAERAEYWIIQASDHLNTRETRLIRDHIRQLAAVPAPRIAACHLDFQSRNLLWHPGSGITLIDFENSRPDLAARDLARLDTRYWPHNPGLKEAFLRGYGPLDSNDIAVLHHSRALEAVTSLAYGLRTGNDDLARHGHVLLNELQ